MNYEETSKSLKELSIQELLDHLLFLGRLSAPQPGLGDFQSMTALEEAELVKKEVLERFKNRSMSHLNRRTNRRTPKMSAIEQPVRVLTVDQAKAERDEIIEYVGGDEETFRRRAEAWTLNEEESYLYSRLKSLDFLIHGH